MPHDLSKLASPIGLSDLKNLNSKFVLTISGKDFVTAEGLLTAAIAMGLQQDGYGISVELLHYFPQEHRAICRATVVMPTGTYSDIGDADPSNVNRMIVPSLIRMAATRARCRALRLATGIDTCAVEELVDENATRTGSRAPRQVAAQTQQRSGGAIKVCPDCGGGVYDDRNDNDARAQRGEKLRPDFKCRDKQGCRWVQWREDKPLPSRKPDHHPSWPDDQGRYCAALKEYGRDYETVAKEMEAKGHGRPSSWTTEERQMHIADLSNNATRQNPPAESFDDLPF